MLLRPYQTKAEAEIYKAWQSYRNALLVLATRGGKTVVFSKAHNDHVGYSAAIAHRQELIGQMSLTLAEYGLRHRIIAPIKVIRFIIQLHMENLGRSFYDPSAPCAVAGIDTLISPRRQKELAEWAKQVTLWTLDEAHHAQKDNKWGRIVDMFPNAKGLGVTANTIRADGGGLGSHSDGIFDTMVVSIGLRDLIDQGYATDYRIFSPTARDLNLDTVAISSKTGDYNQTQLRTHTRKSSVIGDVVEHYIKLANGKLGITFAPDVEIATDIAAKFNAAGVPAEVVSAKTPDKERVEIQKRFKARKILQMVNVDLFGEGYDVPRIEVVSMARATNSFNLFCQQFARGLTLMEGKDKAIIIDHVGNCLRFSQTYGMPDSQIEWSLDRREKRARGERDPDLIPTRACAECTSLYEAIYRQCPYCHYVWKPAVRTGPEFVDGDLEELDRAVLIAMRGEIERIDLPADVIRRRMEQGGADGAAAGGAAKNHRLRQEAQAELRDAIAMWAGVQKFKGRPYSESYRRFYFAFGVDVMTAQTLGRPDAEKLTERVINYKEVRR